MILKSFVYGIVSSQHTFISQLAYNYTSDVAASTLASKYEYLDEQFSFTSK